MANDAAAKDKPATAGNAVDVGALQSRVDEMTARLETLEGEAAKNAETYISSADFEKELETFVPAKVAEAIQAALEGASKPLLEELAVKLEEITAKAEEAVDPELEKLIRWAHSKIDALHGGVSRAIGVTIPLPEAPGQEVSSDVQVTGTEKADRLGG